MNYYNEFDPKAAAWLKDLIHAGLIPKGEVDERDIQDVTPNDLSGFTQCHFFAGIGGWAYALQLAGWAEDRPIWTASCPCQPFSQAGEGKGFDDERHLWPSLFYLIQHGKPESTPIVGEQVASKPGLEWFDLVQDDLEGTGHAVAAFDLCAPGVCAPHIRQRLCWVAVATGEQHSWDSERTGTAGRNMPANGCIFSGLADNDSQRRDGQRLSVLERQSREKGPETWRDSKTIRWLDSEFIYCRDGKLRPIEPGTFPLSYGLPISMGRLPGELQELAKVAGLSKDSLRRAKAYRATCLRGYGNAIVPQLAAEFIRAVMEVCQ